MKTRGSHLLILILTLLIMAACSPAAAAKSPSEWLIAAQGNDGGWRMGPDSRSDALATGWAALGLAAAGRNPLDVRRAGRSPVDFLRAGAARLQDLGDIERTVLVLGAAGVNPRRFGGRDLLRGVTRSQRADGSFAHMVSYTAFGVLALRAAGVPTRHRRIRAARRWLLRQQNRDGGFNFARRGGASGIDDTGGAVQALVGAGLRTTRAVRRGASFLAREQNLDGGFPLVPGAASNAQSTAFAVQGLRAAGRNVRRLRRGTRTPLQYLRSLTEASGRVRYSQVRVGHSVWVTGQATAALALKPFPLRAVPRR